MIALPISFAFQGAASLMGQPWSVLPGEDSVDLRTFRFLAASAFRRTGQIWEAAQWPQIRFTKLRRRLNQFYNLGLEFSINSQVLYPPTNKCYVAAANVVAGATPDAHPELWAELKQSRPIVTEDVSQSFSVGDRVFWSGDGAVYYCKVDGATYGEISGSKFYRLPEWAPDFPLEDEVQGEMGAILGVWDQNPADQCSERLDFELTDHGVRVEGDPGSAWMRYRLPRPILAGDPLDLERAYQPGEKLYYETVAGGDFYEVVEPTAVGDTPDTAPIHFRAMAVPRDFNRFLSAALYADWLRFDGQQEKAQAAEIQAAIALNLEKAKVARQQRQEPGVEVFTR